MIKVLLADKLSQRALELLGEIPEFDIEVKTGLTPRQLKTEIADYEAVVIRGETTLDAAVLQEAINLKLIIKAGVDLDNIDVGHARSLNVEVRYTPKATAVTAAEYTLARMLGICRFIGPAYKSIKEGKWEIDRFLEGVELHGKTMGVIGFGRVGKEVARLTQAMGMTVVFADTLEMETGPEARKVPLHELLKISDFVSIHVPLIDSTRGLMSFEEFGEMKKTAVLIIQSRGGVVDEAALMDALVNEKIKAVAMDVHEDEVNSKKELIEHDRFFPAPYLGVLTVEGEERAGLHVIAVLKEFFNV